MSSCGEPVSLADAALGLVDSERTAALPRGRSRELRRVEVQIEAEDDRAVEPKLGEGPELVTVRSAYLHAVRFYPKATRQTPPRIPRQMA